MFANACVAQKKSRVFSKHESVNQNQKEYTKDTTQLITDPEILKLQQEFAAYTDSLNMVNKDSSLFSDSLAITPSDTTVGIKKKVIEENMPRVMFFNESIDSFKAKTKTYNKSYFMYFHAYWCGPCKKLKKESFVYPELVEYTSKKLMGLSVDTETFQGIELSQKYQVKSLPTMIFFNTKGEQVGKIEGYMEGYSLLKKVQSFYP